MLGRFLLYQRQVCLCSSDWLIGSWIFMSFKVEKRHWPFNTKKYRSDDWVWIKFIIGDSYDIYFTFVQSTNHKYIFFNTKLYKIINTKFFSWLERNYLCSLNPINNTFRTDSYNPVFTQHPLQHQHRYHPISPAVYTNTNDLDLTCPKESPKICWWDIPSQQSTAILHRDRRDTVRCNTHSTADTVNIPSM